MPGTTPERVEAVIKRFIQPNLYTMDSAMIGLVKKGLSKMSMAELEALWQVLYCKKEE